MPLWLHGRPLIERINARLIVDPKTGCHNWQGGHSNGYGQVTLPGGEKESRVYRAVYELYRGKIPKGLEIDHLCHNRRYCNIEHLELVTHAENHRRKALRLVGRIHCKNGHELTEKNSYYIASSPVARCKICRYESVKRCGQRYRQAA